MKNSSLENETFNGQEKIFTKPAEKLVTQIKEKNALIVKLGLRLFIA